MAAQAAYAVVCGVPPLWAWATVPRRRRRPPLVTGNGCGSAPVLVVRRAGGLCRQWRRSAGGQEGRPRAAASTSPRGAHARFHVADLVAAASPLTAPTPRRRRRARPRATRRGRGRGAPRVRQCLGRSALCGRQEPPAGGCGVRASGCSACPPPPRPAPRRGGVPPCGWSAAGGAAGARACGGRLYTPAAGPPSSTARSETGAPAVPSAWRQPGRSLAGCSRRSRRQSCRRGAPRSRARPTRGGPHRGGSSMPVEKCKISMACPFHSNFRPRFARSTERIADGSRGRRPPPRPPASRRSSRRSVHTVRSASIV